MNIAPVRRRTPIAAVGSVDAGRPETPTGGRKKDAVTVGTGHLAAVMASLSRPLPVALVYQFLQLLLRRHTPAAAPISCGCIIFRIAGDIWHTNIIGLAVFLGVT